MAKKQQRRQIIVLGRSRAALETALENADCPLFEAIARWVVQDDNYMSTKNLVARIRELESRERAQGIIPLTAGQLRERQNNSYDYK